MHKTGFSLVETMIAITIAAFVMSGILGVYVVFQRTELSLDASRTLQKQTNFALSRIVDRARDQNINIQSTECSQPTHLCLSNTLGNSEAFVFVDDMLFFQQGEVLEPLFSPAFRVLSAEFQKDFSLHPIMHITLSIEHNKDASVSMFVQTSISSRTIQP